MEKIKVASLFCGCGGMDLGVIGGFSYLGKEYKENPFEIVYAVDNDEYCTKIYNDNFAHKCVVKDVRDIKIEEMPQFDMLIGGFPCQSFSISAQNPPRLGYKDERGMLFFEMVKILKERQPRFFIAENVKGILSANKGKAFPMIMKEFRDAGYTVMYQLLNASEYGVPQKRNRFFMVGNRHGIKFEFPEPFEKKVTVEEAIGDLPDLENGEMLEKGNYKVPRTKASEYAQLMREHSHFPTQNFVSRNNDLVIQRYKYIKQGQNWRAIPDELMQNYADKGRTHSGIYKRLIANQPSVVISNYRRSMLIHP